MSFIIQYQEIVVSEDIPKLSSAVRKKIKSAIETKLASHPDVYGKPLRRSLRNYRKLRVGDYRVIFSIEKNTIKIFAITHRSIVYKKSDKRLTQ